MWRFRLLVLVIVFGGHVTAQKNSLSLEEVYCIRKAKQKPVVASHMQLEEWEKPAFWELYESYNRAIEFIEFQTLRNLAMSITLNQELLPEERMALSVDIHRNSFFLSRKRLQYYRKFCKIIPPEEADRFMILDNLLRNSLTELIAEEFVHGTAAIETDVELVGSGSRRRHSRNYDTTGVIRQYLNQP